MKHIILLPLAAALLAFPATAEDRQALQTLGQAIFLDTTLSVNGNQGCISCHDPASGYSASRNATVNGSGIMAGAVGGVTGKRKPPTIAYAYAAPILHHTIEDDAPLFIGGMFHDGRARGDRFGTPLADQAPGPLTSPVEMALPHEACIVAKVCEGVTSGRYPALDALMTERMCDVPLPASILNDCANSQASITLDEEAGEQVDQAVGLIVRSIAAYETSAEVNRFASRYDAFVAGTGTLTDLETKGLELFENKGLCAECHILDPGPNGEPALFTDFTYDNLGVPVNAENPWYNMVLNPEGTAWIDRGLSQTLEMDLVYAALAPTAEGKQKVPTLRNVAMHPAGEGRTYMHNGYFKTLEGVVRFYNTRDVWPKCANARASEAEALAQKCWPVAEVPATINRDELGNLKLTEEEEAAIVAFMATLTDQ